MADLPIVCTLQPDELARRTRELLPGIVRQAIAQSPIQNGYRYEFTASRECLSAIAAMIDAERVCCRFLRFQLTVKADGGPIRLDVTGPAGTQGFLAELANPER